MCSDHSLTHFYGNKHIPRGHHAASDCLANILPDTPGIQQTTVAKLQYFHLSPCNLFCGFQKGAYRENSDVSYCSTSVLLQHLCVWIYAYIHINKSKHTHPPPPHPPKYTHRKHIHFSPKVITFGEAHVAQVFLSQYLTKKITTITPAPVLQNCVSDPHSPRNQNATKSTIHHSQLWAGGGGGDLKQNW